MPRARLNFREQEENIIYNELLFRGCSVDVGVVEIVGREKKQYEIDFAANKGAKKYYIQSALDVSDPLKLETERRPLRKTNDFFRKIIVSKTMAAPWLDEYRAYGLV